MYRGKRNIPAPKLVRRLRVQLAPKGARPLAPVSELPLRRSTFAFVRRVSCTSDRSDLPSCGGHHVGKLPSGQNGWHREEVEFARGARGLPCGKRGRDHRCFSRVRCLGPRCRWFFGGSAAGAFWDAVRGVRRRPEGNQGRGWGDRRVGFEGLPIGRPFPDSLLAFRNTKQGLLRVWDVWAVGQFGDMWLGRISTCCLCARPTHLCERSRPRTKIRGLGRRLEAVSGEELHMTSGRGSSPLSTYMAPASAESWSNARTNNRTSHAGYQRPAVHEAARWQGRE